MVGTTKVTFDFTQTQLIEYEMIACIVTQKMTDKTKIMDCVSKVLKVPKPTIRRAKRDLLIKMRRSIDILNGEEK